MKLFFASAHSIRYALDTAALLGGNEYLLSQMLDKLSTTPYTDAQREAVFYAVQHVSQNEGFADVLRGREDLNQGHLTEYFTPYNKDRLPSEDASYEFCNYARLLGSVYNLAKCMLS